MAKYLQLTIILIIAIISCLCQSITEKKLQNNTAFPKIVWTYNQTKNYDENVLTKIGSQNIKLIKKNWEFMHLDQQNVLQVFKQTPDLQKILRFKQQNDNNKIVFSTDLIRIVLLKNFGGIYIDFESILTQSLEWINDVTNYQAFIKNELIQNSQVLLLDKIKQQIIYYNDKKNNKNVLLYPSFDTHFIASKKESVFMKQWFDYYIYVKNYSDQKYNRSSEQTQFKDLASQYGIQIQEIIKSKQVESIICAEVLLRKKQIELDTLWTSNQKQKYRTLAVQQYKIGRIIINQHSQVKSVFNLRRQNYGQQIISNQNSSIKKIQSSDKNIQTSLKSNKNNSVLQKQAKYIEIPVVKQVAKKLIVEKQRQIANKAAKLFPATVKLNYSYVNETQPVTVVFTCAGGRFNFFEAALKSFFTNNTYPVRQILAVNDDHYTEQFGKFMSKFPNITFILTNLKVGQIYAIDLAYKYIQTEYFFHSEEDFEFIKPGFIQKSLQVMIKLPKVSQVTLLSWGNSTDGPQGIIDPKKSMYSALSFNPTLKRMSEYRLFSQKFGGYSEYLSFKSFGTGAGDTESCISLYLIKQGYTGYHINDEYIVHTGSNNRLQKFWYQKKNVKPGENCLENIPK